MCMNRSAMAGVRYPTRMPRHFRPDTCIKINGRHRLLVMCGKHSRARFRQRAWPEHGRPNLNARRRVVRLHLPVGLARCPVQRAFYARLDDWKRG
jgi:hypothetical protein